MMRGKIVDHWESREELLSCILASAFIPGIVSRKFQVVIARPEKAEELMRLEMFRPLKLQDQLALYNRGSQLDDFEQELFAECLARSESLPRDLELSNEADRIRVRCGSDADRFGLGSTSAWSELPVGIERLIDAPENNPTAVAGCEQDQEGARCCDLSDLRGPRWGVFVNDLDSQFSKEFAAYKADSPTSTVADFPTPRGIVWEPPRRKCSIDAEEKRDLQDVQAVEDTVDAVTPVELVEDMDSAEQAAVAAAPSTPEAWWRWGPADHSGPRPFGGRRRRQSSATVGPRSATTNSRPLWLARLGSPQSAVASAKEATVDKEGDGPVEPTMALPHPATPDIDKEDCTQTEALCILS